MKRRLNRALSLLLTVAMVIGLLPAMTTHVHAYECPDCHEEFDCEWDEQLAYNYYELISGAVMIELNDYLGAEEYSILVKERNQLKNLEISGETLEMTTLGPQNVVVYTIPMDDETHTVHVNAGDILELHVEADGGVMTYDWQKNTGTKTWTSMEELGMDDFAAKYITGVLVIDPINMVDHPGSYRCEVSNTAGTALSGTLNVIVDPIPLRGVSYVDGEPGIGLTVTANPNVEEKFYPDPQFLYQWQKKSGDNYINIDGATGETFVLPENEIGSTYRVQITSAVYEGLLNSRPITSQKVINDDSPNGFGIEKVDLDALTITLKGITPGQEYAICRYGTSPIWESAVKCTDASDVIVFSQVAAGYTTDASGALIPKMTALEAGKTYAVHSRYYETERYQPGTYTWSQPSVYMGENIKPTHVSFLGETETPDGATYEAPVLELRMYDSVEVEYFVKPTDYTRSYYEVYFGPYYSDFTSDDLTVEKVTETVSVVDPETGETTTEKRATNRLRITSKSGNAGDYYVTAYRHDSGDPNAIYVHELNKSQTAGQAYVNLIVRVGNLKTEKLEIEPGLGGLSIGEIDLANYVLDEKSPGTIRVNTSALSGVPSWINISSDGIMTGTRPYNGAEATAFSIPVVDTAANAGVIRVEVGPVVKNDENVVDWVDIMNIVRPSPGATPAGLQTYSQQSAGVDESQTVVKWYELNAGGAKVTNASGVAVPLSSTDTFKANTKYQVEITLTAESGKSFMLHDSNTDPDYAAINGGYVDYYYPNIGWNDFSKVTVYRVYDTKNCITAVDLYDLLYPISGRTADTSYVIDADGKCVAQEQSADSIWYGTSNGKFKADYSSTYDAWLYLTAEDGYWFATDSVGADSLVQAKVDGEEATYVYASGGSYVDYYKITYNYDQQSQLTVAREFTKSGEITDGIFLYGYLLKDGQYLASGGNRPTTTKPAGGYAYYDASAKKLTLNNFTSKAVSDYYAISEKEDLTIELIGKNSLACAGTFGIAASGKLTFTGTGNLALNATQYGIFANSSITVNGGRVDVAAEEHAVWMMNPTTPATDIAVNGGMLNLTSSISGDAAAYSDDGQLKYTIKGGCLTIKNISSSAGSYASDYYALSGSVNAVGSANADGSNPVEGWNGTVTSDTETNFKYIRLAHTSYVVPEFDTQPANYTDAACTAGQKIAVFDAEMNVTADYKWRVYEPGMGLWFDVEELVDLGILQASGYNSPHLRVVCAGFDKLYFQCKATVGLDTYTSNKGTITLAHTYADYKIIPSNTDQHNLVCSTCGFLGVEPHSKVWEVVTAAVEGTPGTRKFTCADCGLSATSTYYIGSEAGSAKLPLNLDPNYEGAEVYVYFFPNNGEGKITYKPDRNGYSLLGWSYRADDETPIFGVNDTLHFADDLAGQTLYAIWDHDISEIHLQVTEPAAGVVPYWGNATLVGAEGLKAGSPMWYDRSEGKRRLMASDEAFELGKQYSVEVNVWTTGDYVINQNFTGTVNGNPMINAPEDALTTDRTFATLGYAWEPLEKTKVSHVSLTVYTPKDKEAPVLKANVNTDADRNALERYSMAYYQPVGDGTTMDEVTTVFESGKKCRVFVELYLNDLYQFADDVEVTVNGVPCDELWLDAYDDGKVSVQYDWPELAAAPLSISGSMATTGKASVTVENLPTGTAATLMVAQYRDGRMIAVVSKAISGDGTYSISGFTHKNGDTYKCFLLDSTMTKPQCASEYLLIG